MSGFALGFYSHNLNTTSMATAKKRTPAKRKPSATKKRKVKVGEPGATLKLFGRTYKKSMCGLTKTDATTKAKARRATGKGAAIKKGVKGYCLYTRG